MKDALSMADQLRAWGACEDGYEWSVKNCKTLAEVWDKCERGDWLIWLLQQHGWTDKPQIVRVAIVCAEHVLPIFESKYPNDKRPRKAIESAQAWLDNPCKATRAAARAAGDAAGAAAGDAAGAAESKWQADAIRKIVDNPFKEAMLAKLEGKKGRKK